MNSYGVPKYVKLFSFLSFIASLFVFISNYFQVAKISSPKFYAGGFDFNNFNNETGLNRSIIPNLVHYVLFGRNQLNFFSFLSMVSVIKVQCPEEIWIHQDMADIQGRYWDLIMELSNLSRVPIVIKKMAKPDLVFGQPLSSVYHASDIARLLLLQSTGGIYLDGDTLVLKPLHTFLKYEMTLGWPENDYIGTQILIAHKDARLLKGWVSGYKYYKPRTWYYNAGIFPTELLERYPNFIHRVRQHFGVHYLLDKLHGFDPWPDWRDYYSVHLLSRHPPTPEDLDELTILKLNSSFGQMAKWILYDLSPHFRLYAKPHWTQLDINLTLKYEI